MFDVEVDDGDLARCGTPSVAGGLKAPKGGHRRLPNFGKAFGVTYMHQCDELVERQWEESRVE